MEGRRTIKTKIWRDPYFQELDPEAKLIFLYLLTNPATNLAGIYELTIKTIVFETGIEKDKVFDVLGQFFDDTRFMLRCGHLFSRNFHKHQSYNVSMITNVIKVLNNTNIEVFKDKVCMGWVQPVYRLCTECGEKEEEKEREKEVEKERRYLCVNFSNSTPTPTFEIEKPKTKPKHQKRKIQSLAAPPDRKTEKFEYAAYWLWKQLEPFHGKNGESQGKHNFKEADLDKWALQIKKMINTHHRTFEQFKELVEWLIETDQTTFLQSPSFLIRNSGTNYDTQLAVMEKEKNKGKMSTKYIEPKRKI